MLQDLTQPRASVRGTRDADARHKVIEMYSRIRVAWVHMHHYMSYMHVIFAHVFVMGH